MLGNPNIADYGQEHRFKPGNTAGVGNGRPAGTSQAALQKKLEKYLTLETPVILPDGTKTSREVIDRVVLSMLNKACGGDMPAIKEVFDRYYGKMSDKVELTGKDGAPLEVNHVAHLETIYGGMKDAFAVEAIEEK